MPDNQYNTDKTRRNLSKQLIGAISEVLIELFIEDVSIAIDNVIDEGETSLSEQDAFILAVDILRESEIDLSNLKAVVTEESVN